MKKLELLKKINELENEEEVNFILYINETSNIISIDVNDFKGFDEEYNEIDNDELDEEVIDELFNILDNNCNNKEEGFYKMYYFDDTKVQLGYTSYEI